MDLSTRCRTTVQTHPRTSLRRLAISFDQGDKWKTLISRYIRVTPLMTNEPHIAMQNVSGLLRKRVVHNVMIANVGAAAKPSQLP